MTKIPFYIYVPDFIARIGAWLVVLYRKRRYGEAFRKIKLPLGQYAIVDADDYEKLAKDDWYSMEKSCKGKYYAGRIGGGKIASMHRVIMNAPAGVCVDHIDGNGLNNRKSNLRLASSSQNNCNRKAFSNRSSKYKGVSRAKGRTKWRASICYQGLKENLGYFKNEEDAARAYDKAAKECQGEFANLNFG
jgi:hypothetical protein